MTLISVIGDVGSGKTLFTTYIAREDSRPVFSNYKIKLPKRRFHDLKPETLTSLNKPSLVLIDEAYNWLESRLSGRQINLYMSYILFQSRKRGMDIMVTDQLVGSIDLRFREMTNYEIHCEVVPEVGFRYVIYRLSRYHSFKPRSFVMPFDYAEKIYPLYDSWQLINPIDETLMYNISEDKTDIIKKVDKIVTKLLKEGEPKVYTKPVITDYCLRNELSKPYINLIYNAMQSAKIKAVKS